MYYLAAQLQHIWEGMLELGPAVETLNSSLSIILHYTRSASLPEGLESQLLNPTVSSPHIGECTKSGVRSNSCKRVPGFTKCSPIWNNTIYPELAKFTYAPKWGVYSITLMKHIFRAGKLLSFPSLLTLHGLPQSMYFYYFQLSPHSTGTKSAPLTFLFPQHLFLSCCRRWITEGPYF